MLAKKVLICLHFPLSKFLLQRFWPEISVCTFYTKMDLTIFNSFWEDNTKSNTFPPLIGSKTCVRKQACIRNKNCWSSIPTLASDFHWIWRWLKSPIITHSLFLISSFIAVCNFTNYCSHRLLNWKVNHINTEDGRCDLCIPLLPVTLIIEQMGLNLIGWWVARNWNEKKVYYVSNGRLKLHNWVLWLHYAI